MTKSIDKGKNGEREFARVLRDCGYTNARRGQQHKGGTDSPDVVGGPEGFHFEVKRTERNDIYGWLEQANRDASANGDTHTIPVVAHRKNGRPWVAILNMEDLLSIIDARISREVREMMDAPNSVTGGQDFEKA